MPDPPLLQEKRYADFRTSYKLGLADLVRSMTELLIEDLRFDPGLAIDIEGQYVRRISGMSTGHLTLVLTEDPVVRLRSIPDGKVVRAFFARNPVRDACISPNGEYAVIGL